MDGNFNNTFKLLGLIIKREKFISTVWIAILVLSSFGIAPAVASMFPDAASRAQFAASINNPIMIAIMGPVYGLDNYTAGAMYSNVMLLWYLIPTAIMNIFFIIRHTRGDEDAGRVEVVRSLPSGRLAGINAAILGAIILNIILGILTAAALYITGIDSMDLRGSITFGAVTAATGLVFAAIAALFAQLASGAGSASTLSMITMGVFYILRAIGDVREIELIAYISPLGLAQRTQVYVQNHVWPILVLLIIAVVISIASYVLSSVRDMGQGFIAPKQGPANAHKSLLSPLGLTWRLLRSAVITWIVIMVVLSASYATMVTDITSFVGDSPEYLTIIGVPVDKLDTMSDADKNRVIVESFGTFVTVIMTLMCITPLLTTVLKARAQEREGLAEHVYAAAVSRSHYLGGYVLLAFLTSIVLQFLTAIFLYFPAEMIAGNANPFTLQEVLTQFLSFLPAQWVMIAVCVFFVGLLPGLTGIVWGYFGVVVFVSFLGGLFLPDWAPALSPFHFVPQPQPMVDFVLNFTPLIVLTIISAVLTIFGFIGYKKRDLMI